MEVSVLSPAVDETRELFDGMVTMLNKLSTETQPLSSNPSSETCFINRLPTEMLRTIFLAASDDVGEGSLAIKLAISRTCTLWRTIALAFPAFWATIELASVPSAYALSTIIQRAGDQLLHLSYWNWTTYELLREFWCMAYIARTKSLRLKTSSESHILFAQFDAPHIRSLEIALVDKQRGGVFLHATMPSLTEVSFRGIFSIKPPSSSVIRKLHWEGTTRYNTNRVEEVLLYPFLMHCPLLVELEVCLPTWPDFYTSASHPRRLGQTVVLNQLRTASISGTPGALHNFLLLVSSTSVESLTLICHPTGLETGNWRILPSHWKNRFTALFRRVRHILIDDERCAFEGYDDAEHRCRTIQLLIAGCPSSRTRAFDQLEKEYFNLIFNYCLTQCCGITLHIESRARSAYVLMLFTSRYSDVLLTLDETYAAELGWPNVPFGIEVDLKLQVPVDSAREAFPLMLSQWESVPAVPFDKIDIEISLSPLQPMSPLQLTTPKSQRTAVIRMPPYTM